ncbi:DUF2628 domain-containing protein [Caldovatus aquaticus]|uniref:DUF2628 domain-containing protein n=1 Tax=Caldovatus aquaticus TaxID=2865671 RepID=A0ABS7F1Y7_9PROT|nr:DUF2628 domain-containing protein [Caldovatus aquaticus]MBW8269645.1 DUF2628 domain-containing protein [Caldovatus aquaticus]
MRVWTVHAPPGTEPEPAAPDPAAGAAAGGEPARRPRAPVLLREGFSWGAFLFAGPWLLWHRMWLVLALYLATAALIGALLPEGAAPYAALALHLLVGFHARDLRRWTLERHGWRLAAVVAARDEDAAWARLLRACPDLARAAALA